MAEETHMVATFTSRVTLPSDLEVMVERSFAAPRALVFEAWTTPALIQRWLLGPPGWTMPVCRMDVRVGGTYEWRWQNDEGQEFGFTGTFLEVVPPSRLVHTERFDPGTVGGEMGEALVTVDFSEDAGITTQRAVMRYDSKEVRDTVLKTGMTDGMEMSYQELDRLLQSKQAH